MAENKHQLFVTIGATLNSGFNSAISKGTTKLQQVGGVMKDIEKQSIISSKSIDKLQMRYSALTASMTRQQEILQKRAFYHSQIMGIIALGASLAIPIRAAMRFQNSLAGIKSVINFRDPKGLEKLGDELSRISMIVPVTADELAAVAAIGGRFGVPLRELSIFSKEVAKTAIAWSVPVNDTAERVGNLMKVFQVTTSQLPKYFDAINDLGNKTGATADQILQGLNRASDGMANFKLALPNAAALVSTIISFGENAETAGTKVATMLQRLSIAPKLGASTQKALHEIGMSSVTLPKMIVKNPAKTLDKLLTQLSKLNPEKRSSIMYSIFGRGASAMVGKLIDNLALYKKNLSIVAKADLYKGSRNEDYDIVFETLQSKLKILGNTLTVFGREIGFSLMPSITKIVTTITNFLQPIINWISKNKELTSTITTTIAGLIGFKLATFALGYASTFLLGGLNRLFITFNALRFGLTAIGTTVKTFLFGKFGKLIALAGILSSVLMGLSKTADGKLVFSFETLSSRVSFLTTALKSKLSPILNVIKKQFSNISEQLRKHLSPQTLATIKNITDIIKQFVTQVWNLGKSIGEAFASLFNSNLGNRNPFKEVQDKAKSSSQIINGSFVSILNESKVETQNSANSIMRLGASITILSGLFFMISKVVSFVVGIAFSGFGKILMGVFNGAGIVGRVLYFFATTIVPLVFQGVMLMGATFWFFAATVIPTAIKGLVTLGGWMQTVFSKWLPVAFRMLEYFGAKVISLFRMFPILGVILKSFLIGSGIFLLGYLAYKIITDWEEVKAFFLNFWNGIKERFEKNTERISKFFRKIKNISKTAIQFTMNFGTILWYIGKNINAIIDVFLFGHDVIIPAWESIKTFFSNIWNDVKPKFDAFLAKIHELQLTDKIIKAWEKVKRFFSNLIDKLTPAWNKLISPITSLFGKEQSISKILTPSKSLELSSTNNKLPDISDLKTNVSGNRSQHNNFSITINAAKNDDSEAIANKVVNRVSDFGKAFLYDPVPEVL